MFKIRFLDKWMKNGNTRVTDKVFLNVNVKCRKIKGHVNIPICQIWILFKSCKISPLLDSYLSQFKCLGQKSTASSWEAGARKWWSQLVFLTHFNPRIIPWFLNRYFVSLQIHLPLTPDSPAEPDRRYKLSLWPQQRSTFELKIIKASQWVQLQYLFIFSLRSQ